MHIQCGSAKMHAVLLVGQDRGACTFSVNLQGACCIM
jgi:hypothetical protein